MAAHVPTSLAQSFTRSQYYLFAAWWFFVVPHRQRISYQWLVCSFGSGLRERLPLSKALLPAIEQPVVSESQCFLYRCRYVGLCQFSVALDTPDLCFRASGQILKNVFSTFLQPETKATCRTVLPEFSDTKSSRTLMPYFHHHPEKVHRVEEAVSDSSICLHQTYRNVWQTTGEAWCGLHCFF